MTRSPLTRACAALRLPRGLYHDRGDLPLSDAEIRLALRKQPAVTERLVLALTDTLDDLAPYDAATADLVWQSAASALDRHADLPSSMIGVLVAFAMLPEEGAIDVEEWALVVTGAP
jgi:hypothetical protein